MMDGEITTILSQFGAAGLMGLLWITERRHAALRDRQLTEAHRVLVARDSEAAALLGIVRDNTRAIVTLEQTQRRLIHAIGEIGGKRSPAEGATGSAGRFPASSRDDTLSRT